MRGGGTLLVTGDFSYDAQRRRTAASRLAELAGVEFTAENYPNIERQRGSDASAEFSLPGLGPQKIRPCVRVRPVSAEVLGKTMDGQAVLVRNAVGRGQVYYFSDPAELDDTEPGRALRRGLYAAFLRGPRVAAGCRTRRTLVARDGPAHGRGHGAYCGEYEDRRGRRARPSAHGGRSGPLDDPRPVARHGGGHTGREGHGRWRGRSGGG